MSEAHDNRMKKLLKRMVRDGIAKVKELRQRYGIKKVQNTASTAELRRFTSYSGPCKFYRASILGMDPESWFLFSSERKIPLKKLELLSNLFGLISLNTHEPENLLYELTPGNQWIIDTGLVAPKELLDEDVIAMEVRAKKLVPPILKIVRAEIAKLEAIDREGVKQLIRCRL